GAVVYYYLKSKPTTDVVLEFLDAAGKTIRTFTAKAPAPQPSPAPGSAPVQTPPEQPQAASGEESSFFAGGAGGGAARVTTEAGLNRFVWDMRHADAVRFPGMIMWAGSVAGPRITPGRYQVKLTADGKTYTETFELRKDPRISTTEADFARQLDLQLKIRDKLTETHNAIISIREARGQINDLLKRVQGQPNFKAISDAAKSLNGKMTAVEEELYQTKNQSSQDPLNYPIRLNNKLAALGGVVSSADSAPTEQAYAVYEDLTGKINAQLQKLEAVLKTDLPAFNQLVREQNIPAVIVKPPAAQGSRP
ncbi:MAG TPA: hypothetical protein VIQ24_11395, partial [Pyrinomonadaceae bacterium]